MKNKVFLGGTCAESKWRDELVNLIQVDFFNPVVEDWTEGCIAIEDEEKSVKCNIHLYVITSLMIGSYSIAEAVESVMSSDKITIFHVLPNGFTDAQLKSLKAIVGLINKHGGISYIDEDLHRTVRTINNCFK